MNETAENEWQLARKVFEEALLRPAEEQRSHAQKLCGANEILWNEVRSLLDWHERSNSFLESPAVARIVDSDQRNDQLVAGQRLLHYEIQKLIGMGGMGEVYLASDTRLHRNVAVKLLRQDLLPHVRTSERLFREARAAALLEHPNICHIYEISEADGFSFIVMQYVVGTTLDELLADGGVNGDTALDLAGQIADGLAEAHSRGIIHRDIKPANIIVSEKGQAKILDFGLAKLIEPEADPDAVSRMESSSGVMGTIPYMSPEQLCGGPVDTRTDIFSFGALLFEMVCGKSAFRRERNAETISAILNEEPDWSLTSPILRPLIQRCLAKNQAFRFPSASEVAEALTQARLDSSSRAGVGRFVEDDELSTVRIPIRSVDVSAKKTIAILPFKNVRGDAATDFYEFSLADAITTELARLKGLTVRPSSVIDNYRGRTFDPREAGKEMSVDTVLSAAFIHSESRLRVTAQLIDVLTGDIIWSDRVDSETNDILTLQDEITQHIIHGLEFDLSIGERERLGIRPTRSNEAYEEYLRGRDWFARFLFRTLSPADCEAAVASFTRAVEIDPKFALAWSGLGACFTNKAIRVLGDMQDFDRAEPALRRALELDPDIPEARVLMGFIYLARGEKKKARAEAARVVDQFPNEAPSYFLQAVVHRLDGEYDEALKAWNRLERLHPRSTVIATWNRARIYYLQGDYDRALKEIDRGATLEPNHPFIKVFLGQILFYKGDVEEAARVLKTVIAQNPHLEGIRSQLAMVLAAQGQSEEARRNLTQSVLSKAFASCDTAYFVASTYALLGEIDDAFEWLERSIFLGFEDQRWISNDKSLCRLRTDKRFDVIMQRLAESRT